MKKLTIFLIILCSCVSGYSNYQFKGTHFLASYSECAPEALSDTAALSKAMLDAVQDCGATILKSSEYIFPPDGLTMVVLLSESHASIHTYPEHGSCFVDLFTCGNKCFFEKFDASLKTYLQPKKVNSKVLIRDDEIEDIPNVFQRLILGNAGATDLQQATPATKQGMCEHMSDAGGCKDEDAGAVQNQFLKHARYRD